MKIIIDRESVCRADDVDSHEKEYFIRTNLPFEDLFKKIIKDKYLPSIWGNNVVWVLTSTEHFCIFSYFTKTNKFSQGLALKNPSEICKNNNRLKFKYYSSPLKWKQAIEAVYGGASYTMWRDRWLNDFEYCDFIMKQE